MRPSPCLLCKWRGPGKYPACQRPTEDGPLNESCFEERKPTGQCGVDGQFWEQRQ